MDLNEVSFNYIKIWGKSIPCGGTALEKSEGGASLAHSDLRISIRPVSHLDWFQVLPSGMISSYMLLSLFLAIWSFKMNFSSDHFPKQVS